jgi:hypothetical protein
VTFRRRLAWLALFATAFGFLEAVVVVYLRELTYPEGFAFPLRLLPARLEWIEIAREAATIVMLAAAAALAATGFWGRFGAFAVAFGVWDLVYYAGLRVLLGWPSSLATWDVLFLIPGIWTGPVASAAAVAALLVVCGAWMWRRAADGHAPRPRARHLAAALASLVVLLAAFLANHSLVLAGGVPRYFPWALWSAGVAVGVAAFGDLFLRRQ